MIRIAFLGLLLLASSPANAEPQTPVKAMMDLAVQVWSDNPPEDSEYFSAARLQEFYSDQFVQAFEAASKNPPFGFEEGQTTGYPFDYDVITYSQDGCPLEDVKLETAASTGGVSIIKVNFRLWGCSEDATEKALVSEVLFEVTQEGGKHVINDIKRVFDGESLSLVEEMLDIAKGSSDTEGSAN